MRILLKKYLIPVFFYTLLSLAIFYQLFLATFLLIIDPDQEIAVIVLGLLLFSFIPFQLAMWLLFGYEEIRFEQEQWVLIRSNRIFRIRKKIALSDIDSIEVAELEYPGIRYIDRKRQMIYESKWALLGWIRGGRILIKRHHGNDIRIFSGLPDLETENTIKGLNEKLQSYSKYTAGNKKAPVKGL